MKKDRLLSIAIITLFILTSISFIYYIEVGHNKQKKNLESVEVEKARAQFNNLSSLISLETTLSNISSENHGKSMLAFKVIEKRTDKHLNYFNQFKAS
mgnify:CR=1 FL=1